MKNISILGSTGSVGTQALNVIEANPDLYKILALTAHSNSNLLIEQALKFKPLLVVVTDDSKYQLVKTALSATNTKVVAGEAA